ncbi:MAG: sulfur carrier protein ThiS [Chitinophagaceae bacterium]|nr:sulfur carrier protein ThiS [Chitinophagaceae bacterium]MDP1763554.1 sulfur carrier protein ThiS [Sediminibacterium sp.]MDP1811291.1 sulfur carrier protein ThiS [Sediminibacterium sp.]MDP3128026.1 sulfur carrier protein ThiS [Sediminibacterium sp.]MDP3665981.1 sulfur carrier protein ThiS [Sediminibacterium sp.]
MEISLNNQIKEIKNACPVQHLLDEWLGEKQKGIAVAVNGHVIPKINWHTHLLNSNDDVLLIKATQGG